MQFVEDLKVVDCNQDSQNSQPPQSDWFHNTQTAQSSLYVHQVKGYKVTTLDNHVLHELCTSSVKSGTDKCNVYTIQVVSIVIST